MSLKTCKECSREYSDTLDSCPHCGFTESSSIVYIYGYREPELFGIDPNVIIYVDGKEVAKVGRNENIKLIINEPCTISFKYDELSNSCYVNPGDAIVLSFDKLTGLLSPKVMGKEKATCEQSNKKTNDSSNKVLVSVITGLIVALFTMVVLRYNQDSADYTSDTYRDANYHESYTNSNGNYHDSYTNSSYKEEKKDSKLNQPSWLIGSWRCKLDGNGVLIVNLFPNDASIKIISGYKVIADKEYDYWTIADFDGMLYLINEGERVKDSPSFYVDYENQAIVSHTKERFQRH